MTVLNEDQRAGDDNVPKVERKEPSGEQCQWCGFGHDSSDCDMNDPGYTVDTDGEKISLPASKECCNGGPHSGHDYSCHYAFEF